MASSGVSADRTDTSWHFVRDCGITRTTNCVVSSCGAVVLAGRVVRRNATAASAGARTLEEAANTAPTQRLDLRISNVEVATDDVDAQTAMQGGVRMTVRWPKENRLRIGFIVTSEFWRMHG